MSRKSNISLSNRALFYPRQRETLQQHEEPQNSNVVKRDLSKQETANSSFPNLPERSSGWTRRGLRYPRVRVRSHTFEGWDQPNKSNITSHTTPLLRAKASTTHANTNQYNLSYLTRILPPFGANRNRPPARVLPVSRCEVAPRLTGIGRRRGAFRQGARTLWCRQLRCQTFTPEAALAKVILTERSSYLAPSGPSKSV